MIDPRTEDLLTLAEAVKLPELRRNGKAVATCTVWRWIASGKLDSIIVGSIRMTSAQAVRRMIAASNPGLNLPTGPTRQERLKQIREASKRLELAGI